MKKSRNNIILIAYIKYSKYILSLFIFISIIIKTGTTNNLNHLNYQIIIIILSSKMEYIILKLNTILINYYFHLMRPS